VLSLRYVRSVQAAKGDWRHRASYGRGRAIARLPCDCSRETAPAELAVLRRLKQSSATAPFRAALLGGPRVGVSPQASSRSDSTMRRSNHNARTARRADLLFFAQNIVSSVGLGPCPPARALGSPRAQSFERGCGRDSMTLVKSRPLFSMSQDRSDDLS
jgi:hypothetical protein